MMAILDASPEDVLGKVFYVGDEPIRSSVWLDGFFGCHDWKKPVRRVPGLLAGYSRTYAANSLASWVGLHQSIWARLYRMTTDYGTPMAATFDVLGRGPYAFEDGVKSSIDWLTSGGYAR